MRWAGLPAAVVGPSILSKEVETGPTGTQLGPACAQTLSPSPREDAAKWAYPLFLPQELFSSFCRRIDFSAMQQVCLPCFKASCRKALCNRAVCRALKLSAVKLPTVKPFAVQQNFLPCIKALYRKAFCRAMKPSAVQ